MMKLWLLKGSGFVNVLSFCFDFFFLKGVRQELDGSYNSDWIVPKLLSNMTINMLIYSTLKSRCIFHEAKWSDLIWGGVCTENWNEILISKMEKHP